MPDYLPAQKSFSIVATTDHFESNSSTDQSKHQLGSSILCERSYEIYRVNVHLTREKLISYSVDMVIFLSLITTTNRVVFYLRFHTA